MDAQECPALKGISKKDDLVDNVCPVVGVSALLAWKPRGCFHYSETYHALLGLLELNDG
jgi:hypothetical protein